MQRARRVAIARPALERAADRIVAGTLPRSAPVWDAEFHFVGAPDRMANYVLALDALNFCFWAFADQTRWTHAYHGRELDGYWALAASLKAAIEGGIDLTDARVMSRMDRGTLARIFAGRGEIPLFEARLAHLKQAGDWLLDRHDGQMIRYLQACDGAAEQIVLGVTRELSSFDDRALYEGQEVRFFKRAQILALDLASCLAGRAPGPLADLDVLTAFADYKVPQVLRELGVLEYDPDLAATIEARREIVAGSPPEVEIRAATVVAVHELSDLLRERGLEVSEAELDGLLWHLGQAMPFAHPYHRTRTIFY